MSKRRLDDLERRVALLEQRMPAVLLPRTIREARMRAGWSQGELGKRCGVMQSTIARWESGSRLCSGRQADRVADVFGDAGIVVLIAG